MISYAASPVLAKQGMIDLVGLGDYLSAKPAELSAVNNSAWR